MCWWLLTSEKVCVPEWNLLPKSPVMHRDIKTQSGVIHSVQPFTYKQDCIVINCTSWDEGVFNVWSGCLHRAHQQPGPCTQWITEIKTRVFNQIQQLMQLSSCNNKQRIVFLKCTYLDLVYAYRCPGQICCCNLKNRVHLVKDTQCEPRALDKQAELHSPVYLTWQLSFLLAKV